MNFEVDEKRARVAPRARSRERARMRSACALLRRWRPGAGSAGGAAGGSRGERPAGAGGENCALGLRRAPAAQLRWGSCPLLLLNLRAPSSLPFAPAPLPTNFLAPSNQAGGVDGSKELKQA